MTNLKENWEKILHVLEGELQDVSYNTWFKPLRVKSLDKENKILYVTTDNSLAINLVNNRYRRVFESSISAVLKDNYTFSLEYQEEELPVINNVGDKEPEFKDEYYFNPKYSFKNFVVGNNNKLAHAAAVAVAENPSEAYNPLFLYGGSGLGKTHLMHAIGIHILKNSKNLRVLYVTSEMFMNEMVSALRKNELKTENNMSGFRKKYREVDVLLIDDIQFLEDKISTQEEFFNTFNSLFSVNKQIIISSDRPPSKLNKMDERLTSRFQWNLVADIAPPDYETRIAILTNMAELAGVTLNDDVRDVIALIAENIKENVREMEGAFSRIVSFSSMLDEKINLKFSKGVLKDIIASSSGEVTPGKIKKVICSYFNIKESDIDSAKRTRNIAFPRQIAMYICREMTDLSLPKIGNFFGGRDHSTVLHAYDKIATEIEEKESVKEIIDTLKMSIRES